VAHPPVGTFQRKVIVVPAFVPRTVVLPKLELLMTTSASVAPARSGSVTPLIVPVIESPAWTFHFVRFKGAPVCTSPPVGRSRLPVPFPSGSDLAAGASMSTHSASSVPTTHAALGRDRAVRSNQRCVLPLIAAVPPRSL
jgi:hypothetical protein